MKTSDNKKNDEIETITQQSATEEAHTHETTEDVAAALEQEKKEPRKDITVTTLPENLTQAVRTAVTQLTKLIEDLIHQKTDLSQKLEMLSTKLKTLQESKSVNINKKHLQNTVERTVYHMFILDSMTKELNNDIAAYEALLSSTPPATFSVLETEPDNFEECIAKRMGLIKRFTKTLQRNFTITYSRCAVELDIFVKEFSYIELVLKNEKHRKPSAS